MATSATSSPATARKPSPNPTASSATTPTSKESTSSTPANGVARTRATKSSTGSPLSARGSVRKPNTSKSKEGSGAEEDGARAETASLIEDLKSQLRQAETTSEEYEKQISIIQARLDEAVGEQGKLEEAAHRHEQKAEELENENKNVTRAHKELEAKYEKEQVALTKEREDVTTRETEMKDTIQRLKDSIAQRDVEKSLDNTSSTREQSSSHLEESPSLEARESSTLQSLLQKDKIIESLRLELAEAQIKLVEVENAGDGRFQELEKTLLETRMANAKLMEDNESYQYLLSEKTLNGELTSNGIFHTSSPPQGTSRAQSEDRRGSSLAEELENVADEPNLEAEQIRKLEKEVASQKEQNKAMTLYINRIIGKLLEKDGFETLFENQAEESLMNTGNKMPQTSKELPKPLPPPPQEPPQKENAQPPSLLQRAGSLLGRAGRRPMSVAMTQAPWTATNPTPEVYRPSTAENSLASKPLPNPNEDPNTAPAIPLNRNTSTWTRSPPNRSHRRARSEWATNTMYNGATEDAGTSGSTSPPGQASPKDRRSSAFGANLNPPAFTLEDSTTYIYDGISNMDEAAPTRSRSSYGESVDQGSSPPRSVAASSIEERRSISGGGLRYSGSVSGNRMRPLRLVQEKEEADEAANVERKKANRSSFMGWLGRTGFVQAEPGQTQPRPGSGGGEG